MKKWITLINGAILAFSVSACGQIAQLEASGEERKEAPGELAPEEVYASALEVAEKAESLHADISTTQQMKMQPDGMEMDVSIDADMDLIRNSEAFHHQSETTIVSDDIQNDNPAFMEMYFTEKGLYVYEPSMDTWLKLQNEAVEDFKLLADQQTADPARQLENLEAFNENFTLEEADKEYKLILESSGEAFYPVMVEQLKKTFGQMEIGTPTNSKDMDIHSVRYELCVAKSTFQIKSLKMKANFDVIIDGDTMSVQALTDAAYSNYNGIDKIVLPDEVIEHTQALE